MKIETSYVYFGKHETNKRQFKIGETANLEQRQVQLRLNEGTHICKYIKFDGTKDERLFVESYLRARYAGNRNLRHFALDHFNACTINNAKGAENKFFVYVAEAFALLEQIKGKHYDYRVINDRFSRQHEYLEKIEKLRKLAEED